MTQLFNASDTSVLNVSDPSDPKVAGTSVPPHRCRRRPARLILPAVAGLLALPLAAQNTPPPAGRLVTLVKPYREPQVITVGGPNADVQGFNSASIQLAVDALTTRGGGTVRLSKGTFDMQGPVRLTSHITLEGSGRDTILKKCNGFRTKFVVDADWGMLKVTVEDPSGFRVGTGIELYDDLHKQGWDVTTAVITAIQGNVLYIDNRTVNDYLAPENGTIANAFSLVEAVDVEDVRIANLTIDGNKATNDYINGCRGGGVYLHKAKDCVVDNVHVTQFNGDSFSWQIAENITVRNSEASYGGGLGFHPGTGSDSSVVENNVSHHNAEDGFFLCWRVQYGVFRKNVSYANARYGISIGHQDTDNLFEDNHVYENGSHGINFRDETEANAGHRNTFRNNVIENNGMSEPAYGFNIDGVTHDILIEKNQIRSTGKGNQQAAVHIGPKASRITVRDNQVSGHPE